MRVLLGSAAALIALSAGAAGLASRGLSYPASHDDTPRLFVVARGESMHSVARRLSDARLLPDSVLPSGRLLTLYARLSGADRELKSGEFELTASMTPIEMLQKIRAGDVMTVPVTLPDGLTLEEIADRVAAQRIAEREELLRLALDPDFARELGYPASSLEGYLFPETYRFARNTPAATVLRELTRQFDAVWTDADRTRLHASGFSLHELVTLASIVEKETGTPAERPRIAAVFLNRLKRGMRLQSDPTVIYGILRERGHFDGNLRRRDLEHDTPYNTYSRSGLPPGPIASTSLASIRAVLEPEPVAYLYFVSQNDGTHYFSKTLREHNNAVNRFQKRRRRRNQNES